MRRVWIILTVVAVGTTAARATAAWQAGKGPLMTEWAKEVSPTNALPEYPRPQMVRDDWMNLNGLWQLATAQEGEAPPTGKDLAEEILVPFPVESALSGVMKRAERLWYRRTFEVPADWKGRRVLVHFGAVDWEATVYVNGTKVGSHSGGYDAFTFDITDALKPAGPQELIVGVFDPSDAGDQPRGKQVRKPKGIWYTPSTGIWQTVWLEPVPHASIRALDLVPDVDENCLWVTVDTAGDTEGMEVHALARFTAAGPDKVLMKDETGHRDKVGTKLRISFPASHQVQLWSPESPVLHDLEVRLLEGNRVIDSVKSYFGMRKIALGKDEKGVTRMMLNGKAVFHIGFLDQGFWPDGLYTAPTDEALRYDIEVTKKLGFNMARKHVKIEPDRWYYWCDKLGLLVWQDMPSGNSRTPESKKQFETELRRLVEGRHNHPAIIMWVVFNEGWGQHDTERYCQVVKGLDPSRLVSNASGWSDRKAGDIIDIHRYPGPGAVDPEPARAAVLGEFGGLGLGIDGHTWTEKTWGYRGMADRDELTRRYLSLMRGVWRYQDSPGLSGAVYTQTTDVETECNGMMTYDRAIIKVDVEKVAAANRGEVPQVKTVVPTAQDQPLEWRYTLDKPADDWVQPDFDDANWKKGPGGFGRKDTPGSTVRTEWNTNDIWLRREFVLPEAIPADLQLFLHHDEDAEIYINGAVAAKETGYTTDYVEVEIAAKAKAALKPGRNVFAVHCKQTSGGQYIDVGMIQIVQPPPSGKK